MDSICLSLQICSLLFSPPALCPGGFLAYSTATLSLAHWLWLGLGTREPQPVIGGGRSRQGIYRPCLACGLLHSQTKISGNPVSRYSGSEVASESGIPLLLVPEHCIHYLLWFHCHLPTPFKTVPLLNASQMSRI